MTKVTVKLRYLRHSPRKLRPYFAALRRLSVHEALNRVSILNTDSARYITQLLKSGEAAAKDKELSAEELRISQIYATDGPRIKRVRANARGRANHYEKKMAHLIIELESVTEKDKEISRKQDNGTKD